MHDPFKPVEITMRDGRTHVVVDGHDITKGLQGYTLRQDGPQRAELELDVTVLTASVMHERGRDHRVPARRGTARADDRRMDTAVD